MSPYTRHIKKQAKARQRRRHTAQERMARDRRQAQHAAEALQQALDDLGFLKTSWPKSKGACAANRDSWGRSLG